MRRDVEVAVFAGNVGVGGVSMTVDQKEEEGEVRFAGTLARVAAGGSEVECVWRAESGGSIAGGDGRECMAATLFVSVGVDKCSSGGVGFGVSTG